MVRVLCFFILFSIFYLPIINFFYYSKKKYDKDLKKIRSQRTEKINKHHVVL